MWQYVGVQCVRVCVCVCVVGRESRRSSRHTRRLFAALISHRTVRACAVRLMIRPSRWDSASLPASVSLLSQWVSEWVGVWRRAFTLILFSYSLSAQTKTLCIQSCPPLLTSLLSTLLCHWLDTYDELTTFVADSFDLAFWCLIITLHHFIFLLVFLFQTKFVLWFVGKWAACMCVCVYGISRSQLSTLTFLACNFEYSWKF